MRAVPIGWASKAKVKPDATAVQAEWQAVVAYQLKVERRTPKQGRKQPASSVPAQAPLLIDIL
jgi:hypothetical protein